MPSFRPLLTLLALTVALVAVTAAPAQGATRSIRVTTVKNGHFVFKTRGVAAASVRSVRLKSSRKTSRKLQLRGVRRALKRGSVRVAAPRALRKKIRKIQASVAKGTMSPQQAQQAVAAAVAPAALVITTAAASAPTAPAVAGPSSCGSVPGNAVYVAPNGSDSNAGTIDRPFRTLNRADSDAKPGTTIVVRAGVTGESGKLSYMKSSGTAAAPIRIVAYPGETPTIAGQLYIEGAHRDVCGLLFDKPTGPVQSAAYDQEGPKVFVAAADVTIRNSEIRGARGAGIFLVDAEDAHIVNNYVHDNGRFDRADHANLDHGIYFAGGSGIVEGNRIEHNVAHAIQLYPKAHNVTVRNNRMSGHGRAAVMIAEDATNNVVESNDIYGNQRGVETWELRGAGNVARNNRMWSNTSGNFAGANLSVTGNVSR